MKESSWRIVIGALAMIIGIIAGICIQSSVMIEIDNKIRYSELLNWITAIIIGIWVGYILKNKFENSKVIKNYLLDDIKGISIDVSLLKVYCYNLKPKNILTEEERKEIMAKLNIIDKKILIFSNMLLNCYPKEYQRMQDTLNGAFISFNRKVTGDEFYEKNIANTYFDNIVTESAMFEICLRKLNIIIIKEL